MTTVLQHDATRVITEVLGAHGAARDRFDARLAETARALETLRHERAAGTRPFLAIPSRRDDLPALEARVAEWREHFDRLVVLGTGGASLGGQALAALGAAERVVFLDNAEGERLDGLLSAAGLARTAFLVISKSGGTAETLAQAMIALDAASPAQLLVVTEPRDNPLARLATARGIAVAEHDPALGGRFSALSLVGLLPALFAGVDAAAARAGASGVLGAALDAASPRDCAPAVGAALAVALAETRGIGTTVIMPYAPRLGPFGLWSRQLWAESLGKGGHGTNPVVALGPVDQHSQLQLYLDGPDDKLYTIVIAPEGPTRAVPRALATEIGADYLAGRSLADLVAAQARATIETLAEAGRPVRVLTTPAVTADALGALMMHAMLETVIAAHLLGVDPYDQPAVEDGKERARRYLASSP